MAYIIDENHAYHLIHMKFDPATVQTNDQIISPSIREDRTPDLMDMIADFFSKKLKNIRPNWKKNELNRLNKKKFHYTMSKFY